MKNSLKTLCLVLTLGCAVSVSAQNAKKTYTDPVYKMKISYPGNWTLTDTIEGARFFIFSPSQDADDNFTENFNIQALPTEGEKIDLKQYVALNKAELEKGIGEYKKISERYLTQKGIKWYELVYTGKVESVEFKMHFVQRYTIYKETAYVVTYTADATKKDPNAIVATGILNSIGF